MSIGKSKPEGEESASQRESQSEGISQVLFEREREADAVRKEIEVKYSWPVGRGSLRRCLSEGRLEKGRVVGGELGLLGVPFGDAACDLRRKQGESGRG